MKILLVDDEIEFATSLAERLNMRNMDTDWAGSPEDAIEKVEKNCYNIIIMDVKMPRIDGIALKKILQQKSCDLKFIFLTGHGSDEEFETEISEAGEGFYLLKPLKIETLIDKINKALEK